MYLLSRRDEKKKFLSFYRNPPMPKEVIKTRLLQIDGRKRMKCRLYFYCIAKVSALFPRTFYYFSSSQLEMLERIFKAFYEEEINLCYRRESWCVYCLRILAVNKKNMK